MSTRLPKTYLVTAISQEEERKLEEALKKLKLSWVKLLPLKAQ